MKKTTRTMAYIAFLKKSLNALLAQMAKILFPLASSVLFGLCISQIGGSYTTLNFGLSLLRKILSNIVF